MKITNRFLMRLMVADWAYPVVNRLAHWFGFYWAITTDGYIIIRRDREDREEEW